VELWIQLAAVTVATGHSATKGVTVLKDRKRRATIQKVVAKQIVVITVHSFEDVPAVVFPAGAGCRLKVDLLPAALPHVGDKEVSGGPVERAAPRIPHAICPNLIKRPRVACKRIVRWNSIIAVWITWKIVSINVNAEDFAQPGLQILGIALAV